MPSDHRPNVFTCSLCGGHSWRLVVSGQTSRQQAAGHGEISMEDYACTNRGHGKIFQVVECTACTLRMLWPWPEPEAVERAYTRVHDSEYLTIEPSREIAFQKLLKRIKAIGPDGGRLLDVGCYTGVFPWLAAKAGWDALGIEPSAWAATIADKRLPGKVRQGYLSQAGFEPGSFDAVTSWDVIEHVTDPRREITLMANLLKPGGWLFLSTMDSRALIVSVLGAKWPWYMPMHLFYFTPKTLSNFIREAGLEIRHTQPYPHYTTVQYAVWKLEPYVGALARILNAILKKVGFSKTVIKIDLGDFFMVAAQKKPLS
ncbi:MAG: class I SAM-dependent methyltransferase [Candidatus Andersenbacteria bacterium]|nr:class I SAM-dependent methyltransferase [Candidatus Andersenbacteria bacterium]